MYDFFNPGITLVKPRENPEEGNWVADHTIMIFFFIFILHFRQFYFLLSRIVEHEIMLTLSPNQ